MLQTHFFTICGVVSNIRRRGFGVNEQFIHLCNIFVLNLRPTRQLG